MQRRSSRNIPNMRRSVPSPDETLRRESSNHKVIVSTPFGSTQSFSSEPPVASSSHAGIFRGVVFPLPPPLIKVGGGGRKYDCPKSAWVRGYATRVPTAKTSFDFLNHDFEIFPGL